MKIRDIISPNWEIIDHSWDPLLGLKEINFGKINFEDGNLSRKAFLESSFKLIVQDSRQVNPTDLFVAITCDTVLDHIQLAIEKGACGIVIEKSLFQNEQMRLPEGFYILVKNTREALGQMAARQYPQQPARIYAVTGTNGKSSVVTFLRQILGSLGKKAVSFGTVGLEISSPKETSTAPILHVPLPKLTTPDALSLHEVLDTLTHEGVNDFVFEASSHGLDQYRLHQVAVTVAAFTNLTQDHLDYHESMDAYFEAKSRLFTHILRDGGSAVINAASPYGHSLQLLLKQRPLKIITYGVNVNADIEARQVHLGEDHITFDLLYEGENKGSYRLNMIGDFQLENILCATAMALAQGFSLPQIVSCYDHLRCAKGRMELAGTTTQGGCVYVDYAHTPDALERALKALRRHLKTPSGKLTVVFGCGGNRDVLKRPLMGQIAEMNADHILVTDDNPRYEDPNFIRAQILSHCPKGLDVPDRYKAISQAIHSLGAHDILLIAGKGHEQGQIVRDHLLHFDDVKVVQDILQGPHTKGIKK